MSQSISRGSSVVVLPGQASAEPEKLFGLAKSISMWTEEVRLVPKALVERRELQNIRLDTSLLNHAWDELRNHIEHTADAFTKADVGRQEYRDRIAQVAAQIKAWAPTNHDNKRAAIAKAGEGQLLTFDPRKDGRVVEALGDLAGADHILIFIPGMDNDITDFPRIRERAEAIRQEMQKQAKPGERVAVIAWLGYDTPDHSAPRTVTEGGRSQKAKEGAKTLVKDIAFVKRVNSQAHLTVLGHSYGSVVLGQSMKRGLDADDAIAVGSPGMDANDRKKLKSPKVKLWATRKRSRDIIPMVPTHGEDPAAKGFHANRFRGGGAKNHSDYFRPGTEALTNIAKIAVGKQPTV